MLFTILVWSLFSDSFLLLFFKCLCLLLFVFACFVFNSMSIIVFVRVLMFFVVAYCISQLFLVSWPVWGLWIHKSETWICQNIQTWQHCSWTRLNYFRYVSFDCKAIGQKNPNLNIVASSLVRQPNRKSILGRSCSQAGKRAFAFFYFSQSKTVFTPVRAQRPRISCTVNSHCILWNLAVWEWFNSKYEIAYEIVW